MNRCLHSNSSRLISRILGAFLLVTVFTIFHSKAAFAQSPGPVISLIVDGIGVKTDVPPLHQNGRILVPIRFVAEQLGTKVSYDADSRRVTLRDGVNQVAVFADSRIGYVNGERVTLDTATVIQNQRTMIPVRFVSETLGYSVAWDNRAKVVKIRTRDEDHEQSAKIAASPVTAQVKNADLLSERYVFPFDKHSHYEAYGDSYGSAREWSESHSGNARSHEGIDIMAPQGTPVYSVGDGVINRIGWNTYGGWRINITDDSGKFKMYYAHLQAYCPDLQVGTRIQAGQLIGFVGTTGYGAPGTSGMFPPHLHFGLYRASDDVAFNPYSYLQFWENNKVD
ncbi:stalk domain-containing protein [Brevibacillus ruminantium]|uniref:Stalk domain-containing protein n=1 Tax=Brevibacillus ruminantium TaxID=2950604 RepID=A0ABY4WLT5_9BACL|nr:stalk domain-containing protein [Brevibacillus ruminantium]USG67998.1 stalk domain-containing protein [Brevibacillus ruminantium]